MTPVISPWVFYAISVADGAKVVAIIGIVLAICFVAVFCILAFTEYDWADEVTDKCKRWIWIAKRSAVVLSAFVALAIFVPSSETIKKMIVAQNVTYERVEVGANTVQDVYEDIMELFGEEESDGSNTEG